MKKFLLIGCYLYMIFFNNFSYAKYEKVFFDFKINDISGKVINFKDYKGKIILSVNTASYCGFTKQYSEMQKLWDKYKNKDVIIFGVPSNSFNQEKNSDDDVKKFCEVNFNINFPMSTITNVKGKDAHEIYKWAKNNFGKSAVPKWNFHKILINKDGKIEDTYSSLTSPNSKKIISKIDNLLN